MLEIGTPFSLADGSAINLYVEQLGPQHILISDNGDTLMQMSAAGIDVWSNSRLKAIRLAISGHKLALNDRGDIRMVAQVDQGPLAFAQAITGMLALNRWIQDQLQVVVADHDLAAEAEPYILARNPLAKIIRNVHIQGASRMVHAFSLRHDHDLIDVIAPSPQSTGAVMRKVGDVVNGPFVEPYAPLIIVDDRYDPYKADKEISILASIVRTQSFSQLTGSVH
ncbi:MAG: DUF1828 domain-containing protein [Telluria sp.]